jgi:hypothetical protein
MLADHFSGLTTHLANRGTPLLWFARPIADIEALKKRMGWKFKWVSSFANDFNRDYHVSFTIATRKASSSIPPRPIRPPKNPMLVLFRGTPLLSRHVLPGSL